MRLTFTIVAVLLLSAGAFAQGNAKISGNVFDSLTQKPVEFANVALARPGSSTPIDGTICDENGEFTLSKVAEGKYQLLISFIGFETRVVDISVSERNVDVGRIIIAPTPQVLEAVTVEGQRALIEERVDRLVYNAENDIASRGGDATDVLKKVPMLSVDLDGNVSLRGNQNILVLINNKPSSIVASSVSDALKQIPADEIKSVEVITSPSAKYDAEGSAGIINIITKKNTLHGLTLNINSGIGLRGSNLGLNGNFRTGKMGFSLGGFGRSFYNTTGSFENEQLTRAFNDDGTVDETLNVQSASTRNRGLFGNYNIGWDYDIDKKNTLAASVRFGVRNNNTFQDDLTTHRYFNDALMSSTLAGNENKGGFNNVDASFNYTHYYDKPQREFSFQSMYSRNTGTSLFENFVLNPDDESLLNRFRNDNDSYNEEVTFQADYMTPIGSTQILEFGGKNIMRKVFSDFTSFQAIADGPYQPSTTAGFNNNLNYDQDIVAGYFAYTLSLKNGYSFKAGARYEHTVISAYTKTEDDIEIPSYGIVVPSVNVSKRLKNNNTLKASYNRRIQRPSIRYLNPNIQRDNNLDVTVGNPELAPEYTNNFELSYSTILKGLVLNMSGFARLTNDGIQSVRTPAEIEGVSVLKTTYQNIGIDNAYGSSIFLNVSAGKLSINGGTDVYYSMIDNNNPVDSLRVSNEGMVASGRVFGNYDFGKGWGAQFFSFYRGRRVQLQGTQGGFYMYSLGFRKEFNEKRGSIGLAAENFLQPSIKMRTNIESPLLRQTRLNTRNNLSFRVTFSYRIGKMSMDQRPRRSRGINNDDLKDDGGGDGGIQMGSEGMGQQGTNGQGGGRRQQAPARKAPNNPPSAQVAPTSDDEIIHEAAGTWTYTIDSPQGGGGTIVLTRSGEVYSGIIRRERAPQDVALENVLVKGNDISFSFPTSFGGNTIVVTVAAVISEAAMTGTMHIGETRSFNLTGKRSE
ncbi:MAG: TonB-dependent receptor [Bacteroidota bacterium]|nr:TonB-dependent receptor [Bacteroidota bacterium]